MALNDSSFLLNKKILIVCHYSATAFIQHLEEYLIDKKAKKVLYVSHPLYPKNDQTGSFFRLTEKGKVKQYKRYKFLALPDFCHYLKDVLLTVWWVIIQKESWDVCISADNLNTFTAILLKKLGFIKKVVFYTVDFVPNRFSSPFLNDFYHWVEKFAVIHSDEVWVLSPRVIEGRHEYLKLDKKYDARQILVPEGVWIDRIVRKPFDKIQKHNAVFVGHIIKRMGVQLVVKAIPLIIKKIPNFKFIIIGKGNYISELEKLVNKLKIEKHVEFRGYVEDHKDVENIIASCGVGIATYTKEDKSGLTYYADPAKTKTYLGAGLPVIMTDTFYNAYDIENAGAGIVVEDSFKDVANGIIKILEDDSNLRGFRKNALKFAAQFDHPKLFNENLKRILFASTIGQYRNDVFQKMGVAFEKNKKILDVGCGNCVESKIFIEKYGLKVYGIDIYKHENVSKTKKLNFKKGSVFNIPYKSNSFDYVFLHDVLHHIDEKDQSQKMHLKALDEIRRVCKKNGKIILLEANRYNPLFYPHMVWMRHHDHFTQGYFKKIILTKFANANFKYFESHVYPIFLLRLFKGYEFIMENLPFLKKFRAYNLAIIKNE